MRGCVGWSSRVSSTYSFHSINFKNVLSGPSTPMICYSLMHTDTAR